MTRARNRLYLCVPQMKNSRKIESIEIYQRNRESCEKKKRKVIEERV